MSHISDVDELDKHIYDPLNNSNICDGYDREISNTKAKVDEILRLGYHSTLSTSYSSESLTSSSSKTSKNKYLYPNIDTVELLLPEQIRWFYKGPLDKKWKAFIGYDSLRLECKYRETIYSAAITTSQFEDEERINCRGGLYQADVKNRKCYPVYWSAIDEEVSILRGIWFIASTWQPLDECYAAQIETEHLARFEGQSIVEDTTEKKHSSAALHTLRFKDFYVEWMDVNSVYLHSEAKSSKFYRALSSKFGYSKGGTQLQRGYWYEATMEDKPKDISHLVFVIHGIGQKMETGAIINSCSVLRNRVNKVKEKYMAGSESLERAEFLPVEWRSKLHLDGGVVDLITPLKLKNLRTALNYSALDILYYSSPLYRTEITKGVQTELNRIYEMFSLRNPYFEDKGGKVSVVAHSLGTVITYDIITGWNPIQLYDQYVSSVICPLKDAAKDLNSNFQDDLSDRLDDDNNIVKELGEARKRVNMLENHLQQAVEANNSLKPSLKFKVHNFFCLGSPLAVFLALRGIRPSLSNSYDAVLPKTLCHRLYNIYHPSDPVAYRIEPIILKNYSSIKPILVHRFDATEKCDYDVMKPSAYTANERKTEKKVKEVILENGDIDAEQHRTARKSSIPEKFNEILAKWSKRSSSGTIEELIDIKSSCSIDSIYSEECFEEDDSIITIVTPSTTDESSCADDFYTTADIDKLELDYRIDYQLKEKKMENAYWSVLTSHTSYWSNYDVAYFIIGKLFPEHNVDYKSENDDSSL